MPDQRRFRFADFDRPVLVEGGQLVAGSKFFEACLYNEYLITLMLHLDDKRKAIEEIEGLVQAKVNRGKVPRKLIEILFERLYVALRDGKAAGRPLARETAYKFLEENGLKEVRGSTFKHALSRLRDVLSASRVQDAPTHTDNGNGEACIKALIGSTNHWIFVRGPHDPGDTFLLQLCVEFRPIVEGPKQNSISNLPSTSPILGGATLESFGAELSARVESIQEQLTRAWERFGVDNRLRKLIYARSVALTEQFDYEAGRLSRGEIVVDYYDCSVLTDWIRTLGEGEELLGLTDWNADRKWWSDDDAKRFLEANAEAIRQKASIRRIFVYTDFDSAVAKEIDKHVALGVKIRTISREQFSGTPISQCILRTHDASGNLRGSLTYRVETADGFPARNVFSVNPEEIRQNEGVLKGIWNRASSYP